MTEQLNRPTGRLGQLLQRVGDSRRAGRLVTASPAAREVASRFVASEDLAGVLEVVEVQRAQGLTASLAPLLDEARDRAAAAQAVEAHVRTVEALAERGLARHADLSVRLSTLGLSLPHDGRRVAQQNLATICRAAGNAGVSVTLDMEAHEAVDDTFAIFSELQQDHPWLGVTVQSQLRRSLADCRWLATLPVRVRLCKGGYLEPRTVSFDDRHATDLSFVRCMGVLMAGKGYPMLATHDPRLVAIAEQLAERHHRSGADYEFQMFHGVRPWEQRRLVDTGHRVRVHLPFGPGWYSYLVRRVAERPANVGPLLRALVTRR